MINKANESKSYNKESLIATAEHPFYIENVGFVEAEDITIGDPLRLASGEVAVVESVEKEIQEELEPMYNLEIEEFHTYYVGMERVLVHNTCGNGSKGNDGTTDLLKTGDKTPNGRSLSKHGAERANERGFTPATIDSIIDNNLKSRKSKVDAQGRKTWE